LPNVLSLGPMPSRQERRKAERDAAKRAPAKAGAAGAGGAAAAGANVNMNPVGDWTTQTSDPFVLFRALGDDVVKQKADAGDRESQFSLGYRLLNAADSAAGATLLGAGGRSPKADEGTALLEQAAGQGHAYAMEALGHIQYVRKEYEQAVAWLTKGAEAGLPRAMRSLGRCLEEGEGVAPQDYPAAADWYRRAAEAGDGAAAGALSNMYSFGRGVACQIMPATSTPHFSPSFLELDGNT